MPDNMLVGLNADLRKALVESPDSASVTVLNAINEPVVRTAFSADYIALQTSEAGTMQLKLLPLVNNTDIVAVITTVCGDACDSSIDFYTTTWQALPSENMFPPKQKEWFISASADRNSDDFKNAVVALDMTPIKLTFAPDNTTITAVYDLKNYLADEEYKLIEPFLFKESRTLRWDKLSFKE
ncbi:MAG: hypothetical protein RL662_484 [Bacteroidota bacterium]|jgi:hypothetical protein